MFTIITGILLHKRISMNYHTIDNSHLQYWIMIHLGQQLKRKMSSRMPEKGISASNSKSENE